MDKSADPCVDFYRYACGEWNKLNPIPADQSHWDVYTKLEHDNQRYLWGILEEASHANAASGSNEQKIGDAFAACMNLPAIEKASRKPLAAALARIAAMKSFRDIAAYVATEHRGGIDVDVLFGFDAEPDFDRSARMLGYAFAGGLGLPDREYYTQTDSKSIKIRARYVQHVAQNLELLGEPPTKARADAAKVMAIETALAKASFTRVELRDSYKLRNRFTREKLIVFAPHFDWETYWDGLETPNFKELNVTQPKFFSVLNSMLVSTKLADWQSYLRWHLVHSYSPYLASSFSKSRFNFYSAYLRGIKTPPPRWRTCTNQVDRQLGEALGQVFVARTFKPETKSEVLKMVKQIETEMHNDIQNLTWMSDATKKKLSKSCKPF